jgi:hypothetical protein
MSQRADRVAMVVGLSFGALAAVAVLALRSGSSVPRLSPPLPEDRGALSEVAFHLVPGADALTRDLYRALLPAFDASTRLVAVVPEGSTAAAGAFLAELRLTARTRVVEVKGPITPWSKDRALVSGPRGGRATLLVPARPSEKWAQRLNDWSTPSAIAAALPERYVAVSSELDFDAGDFAVTADRVVVDVNLVEKNKSRGFEREPLVQLLERIFERKVLVLGAQAGDVPRHHLSMYTALLQNVALVGDPAAGKALVGEAYLPGEDNPDTGEALKPDWSAETQARFDRAARELAAAGFKVERIPTVAFDDKTYFAYTNGVYETRAGRKVAWVPVFGEEKLDAAALAVYARLGWETVRIPSRAAYPYHGTVGCLVNVLAREGL